MRIGYAKIFSDDQPQALQLEALTAAGCKQIFQEKNLGNEKARPELKSCLEILKNGDILVIWRLDRLGYSLKDLIGTVRYLEQEGIGFLSITENIDTTRAGGEITFHIFAALAEFDHNLIRERTITGLNAARARGRKGGRKLKMTKADVRKAAAMLSDPFITKTEVAQHFEVSRVTLNAALEREGYVHSSETIKK